MVYLFDERTGIFNSSFPGISDHVFALVACINKLLLFCSLQQFLLQVAKHQLVRPFPYGIQIQQEPRVDFWLREAYILWSKDILWILMQRHLSTLEGLAVGHQLNNNLHPIHEIFIHWFIILAQFLHLLDHHIRFHHIGSHQTCWKKTWTFIDYTKIVSFFDLIVWNQGMSFGWGLYERKGIIADEIVLGLNLGGQARYSRIDLYEILEQFLCERHSNWTFEIINHKYNILN